MFSYNLIKIYALNYLHFFRRLIDSVMETKDGILLEMKAMEKTVEELRNNLNPSQIAKFLLLADKVSNIVDSDVTLRFRAKLLKSLTSSAFGKSKRIVADLRCKQCSNRRFNRTLRALSQALSCIAARGTAGLLRLKFKIRMRCRRKAVSCPTRKTSRMTTSGR